MKLWKERVVVEQMAAEVGVVEHMAAEVGVVEQMVGVLWEGLVKKQYKLDWKISVHLLQVLFWVYLKVTLACEGYLRVIRTLTSLLYSDTIVQIDLLLPLTLYQLLKLRYFQALPTNCQTLKAHFLVSKSSDRQYQTG